MTDRVLTENQHRFRKKPVVIEAFRIESPGEVTRATPQWLLQAIVDGVIKFDPSTPCAMIDTLEGSMRADVGDWIIKGVKGELYPCKPDIFEATYERA